MTVKEKFVNSVFKVLFSLTCRLDIDGLENIPSKGPAILISNHTSNLEGPLYYIKLRPRKTIALAKKELWDKSFTRLAMTAWNSIPVDREGMDLKALRSCFDVLDNGNFLCIAPEGTRSRDGRLKKAMPGTTYFALRKKVPIYPMVQWGLNGFSENIKHFRRTVVHVRIGKPFYVEKKEGGRLTPEKRQKMADEMMYKLAELLPPEYRGYYSSIPAEYEFIHE